MQRRVHRPKSLLRRLADLRGSLDGADVAGCPLRAIHETLILTRSANLAAHRSEIPAVDRNRIDSRAPESRQVVQRGAAVGGERSEHRVRWEKVHPVRDRAGLVVQQVVPEARHRTEISFEAAPDPHAATRLVEGDDRVSVGHRAADEPVAPSTPLFVDESPAERGRVGVDGRVQDIDVPPDVEQPAAMGHRLVAAEGAVIDAKLNPVVQPATVLASNVPRD